LKFKTARSQEERYEQLQVKFKTARYQGKGVSSFKFFECFSGSRFDSLPRSFGGGLGWGSSEEAPDACFSRRFLVLIFFAMSTPLLPRDRARRLRRDQTDERRLWMRLRRHQLGVRFRRQHPIGPYIVDFCCV
jgi:hypothetical protein